MQSQSKRQRQRKMQRQSKTQRQRKRQNQSYSWIQRTYAEEDAEEE